MALSFALKIIFIDSILFDLERGHQTASTYIGSDYDMSLVYMQEVMKAIHEN